MLSIAAFSSMPTMDVRKDRCRPPTCTMGVVMVVRSSVWARSTPAAGTMMMPSTLRATSDSTVERGYQCVWRMFADSDARPPEAVICADDMIALGAMIALQTLGIRVPDDVRVVGYDDSPLALTTMPTLTSVRPPFLQIVTEALRLIGQGPDQAAHISLLPQLIVRGSTVVRS